MLRRRAILYLWKVRAYCSLESEAERNNTAKEEQPTAGLGRERSGEIIEGKACQLNTLNFRNSHSRDWCTQISKREEKGQTVCWAATATALPNKA